MKISIKNKLLLTFIALIIMIVVAQLIFNTFFAQSYYSNYKENAIISAFVYIKNNYTGSANSIIQDINEYEDSHNIHITISDQENLIYNSKSDYPVRKPTPNFLTPKGITNKDYSENPKVNVGNNDEQRSFMTLYGKFYYNSNEILVSLSLPTDSIESSVDIFAKSSTIISVSVLFIGILFSIIIAKSITKPIEEIEKVAFKLSKLDFSHKTDESVKIKEVASLSTSINLMSDQLENSILNLSSMNEKLQKDVDYQKQIEQMRREFVANVSHEMKTPLALLQLYSENLKNNVENIDKEYYCDTIIEETEYLNKMVKSMLDISAIESGVARLEREKFNITDMCEQFIGKMQPMLEQFFVHKNIEENLFFNGDKKLIEQVMSNYIINAIAHMSEGNELKISLIKQENSILFSVYNDGSKISEENLAHIWDSFYKSDTSHMRTANGNVGLGLYIVKTIIEKHNGKYFVENIDNGVCFSFELNG